MKVPQGIGGSLMDPIKIHFQDSTNRTMTLLQSSTDKMMVLSLVNFTKYSLR
jgi:hypothetical protein